MHCKNDMNGVAERSKDAELCLRNLSVSPSYSHARVVWNRNLPPTSLGDEGCACAVVCFQQSFVRVSSTIEAELKPGAASPYTSANWLQASLFDSVLSIRCTIYHESLALQAPSGRSKNRSQSQKSNGTIPRIDGPDTLRAS